MQSTRIPILSTVFLGCLASAGWAQQAGNLVEAPEPNGSLLTAGVIQCGRQGLGNIRFSGVDSDYWCFTLSSASEVRITVSPRESGGSFLFSLLDANGGVLFGVGHDVDCAATPIASGCYSGLRTDLDAGTYYVVVLGGQLVQGSLMPSPGDYALDLVCYPPSGDAFCPSLSNVAEVEPNDSTLTAQPIGCCTSITGQMTSPDSDLYRLDVTTPQVLIADWLYHVNPSSAVFPRLVAADGLTTIEPFLRRNQTSFRLHRVLMPGTYYLRDSTGFFFPLDYTLDVDCRPITGGMLNPENALVGSACQGSAGNTPSIVTYPNELPMIGSTYSVFLTDTDDGTGASFVWALVGAGSTINPGIDLGALGAPGCELYVVSPIAVIQLTNDMFLPPRTPTLTLEWFIVNDLAILGQSFSVQGLVWNQPEILTTNAITATVGNWLLD